MKPHYLGSAILVAAMFAAPAMAEDDCNSPMAQWQPREQVYSQLEQLGITVERLRIDDGCYKARGVDSDGNRLELQLDPGTLNVMELEIRFRPGADIARYLPPRGTSVSTGNR